MPRPLRMALLLAALPLIGGCRPGAYIPPLTAFEREMNGTYEGVGVGLTGHVPYRLIMSVQQKGGRVSGVMTNLESSKAYAVSGSVRQIEAGGAIEAQLFEGGDQHRGTLRVTVQRGVMEGNLRTVLWGQELLSYNISLKRVEAAGER